MRLPQIHHHLIPTIFFLLLPTLGHTDFQAGMDAYKRGDYETTLKEWRPLAEQGDAGAQFSLGVMYSHFHHGLSVDYGQAAHWYRLAAEQGHGGAQTNLGTLYQQGEGVPQNDEQAVHWYRLAAEQGFPEAQANLGHQYQVGQGVPKNYTQALMWYNLAIELGQKDAEIERDLLARLMTPEQITKAQGLAHAWLTQYETQNKN
jgi:TPR repeat protein